MRSKALGAVVGAILLGVAGRALATLGEPEASVASDCKALSAVQRASTRQAVFTVEELASSGNVVREYVSNTGIVFAVAWRGLTHPDLGALLGSFAAEYREAARAQKRTPGRPAREISTAHVVVETWGHMRNLQGRAYLPSLVPAGMSVDDIK
jgi:hypothetical protein